MQVKVSPAAVEYILDNGGEILLFPEMKGQRACVGPGPGSGN